MKWLWGVRERPAHKSLTLSLNETRPDITGRPRGWDGHAPTPGIAKICPWAALILPLRFNLIRFLSCWGEHEMQDFMRVSLAIGASALAPGGWDRGV